MKRTWSTDFDEITKEIDLLVCEQAKLYCLRENSETIILRAKGKTAVKNKRLLVVSHPCTTICSKNQCHLYYQRQGFPVRGFHCTPEKLVNGLLGVQYPIEIFEVQRRKFPRVQVARDSRVSFSLRNRQKFYIGKVEDVSLQGARIRGDFPMVIEKGVLITPMTLILTPYCRQTEDEVAIHVPEATVMRSMMDGEKTAELAIHFILEDLMQQQKLSRYVDALLKQEEVKKDENIA
ncbi:MAG: PilZ domain-containing protein [Thermodesulfobacteriota bacterium]